ncbi:hypothetical protein ABES02_29665, partial [Neobacillus pocheonensis]|uniref:hypothetical protein n=1 Tax=Neobacillus pocheonensis TaxID=363869 RepID=UPI003D2C2CD7
MVGRLEEAKGRGLIRRPVLRRWRLLLSFSTSDIRTYFESVIIANHTEPLRAMVTFLFRERHPGKP